MALLATEETKLHAEPQGASGGGDGGGDDTEANPTDASISLAVSDTTPASSDSVDRRGRGGDDRHRGTHAPHHGRPSDPDRKSSPGLLFVAHDGIANPELWMRWNAEHGNAVRMFVFANADVKLASPEWESLRLKTRVATKWGDRSIAHATQATVAEILTMVPPIDVIYVVSGADIPIQSAATLCAAPPDTRIAYHGHDFASRELDAHFRRCTGLSSPPLSAMMCMHDQWMCLSRTDAATFASTSMETLDAIDKWFETNAAPPDPYLARLAVDGFPRKCCFAVSDSALAHFRDTARRLLDGLAGKPCADNYYIGLSLALAQIRPTAASTTTTTAPAPTTTAPAPTTTAPAPTTTAPAPTTTAPSPTTTAPETATALVPATTSTAPATPALTTTKPATPAELLRRPPVTRWLKVKGEFLDTTTDPGTPYVYELVSPSPHTFRDLKTPEYAVGVGNTRLLSLHDVIAETRRTHPTAFFLRKVAAGVFRDLERSPWSTSL
jgi:hypothetical protein